MCYFCAPKRGFLGHFRGVPFVGPPGPERLTNFFCYLGSKECHRLSETYAEMCPVKTCMAPVLKGFSCHSKFCSIAAIILVQVLLCVFILDNSCSSNEECVYMYVCVYVCICM